MKNKFQKIAIIALFFLTLFAIVQCKKGSSSNAESPYPQLGGNPTAVTPTATTSDQVESS